MKIYANIANTFWKKALGLISPSQKPPLLLHTHFGIHTFFMQYAIDILVLDKNSKVVKQAKNLKPFKFFFYSPFYKTILELPSGFIAKNKIKLGDKIYLHKNKK